MKRLILLSLVVILASCKEESQKPDPTVVESTVVESIEEITPTKTLSLGVARIVDAHGMQNWDKVEQIAFTFNVDREGKNVAKRSWIWNPKTDDVTMITAEDTIAYNRNTLESEFIKADQGFINDKYWLLAPFQIAWDEGTTITAQREAQAPLSQKTMKKLTLTYGSEGGYTPGDAYDFYYENPGQIEEWVFRKGNAQEPSMITTFEGYKEIGGMQIATDHKDKDGSFRLYFTDVTVKMID